MQSKNFTYEEERMFTQRGWIKSNHFIPEFESANFKLVDL